MFKKLWLSKLAIFTMALLAFFYINASLAFAQQNQKIVLFYSSMGYGHLSAARAVADQIKITNPNAEVVLKDFRDFYPKIAGEISKQEYWFAVKNMPDFFDKKYREFQANGQKVMSLSDLPNEAQEDLVTDYLKKEQPTAIISTFYGAANFMGNLRDKGLLKDTKVGWVHTDYFTGFFPRISKRIDMTFLGHPNMVEDWLAAGVPAPKVAATGIPVNPKILDEFDSDAFMKSKGLDPDVNTVTITGGSEGVGDFEEVINQLVQATGDTPLQIVAVAAKNDSLLKSLQKLSTKMPEKVKLVPFGLVENRDLLKYIKSSDVYVTKTGGLSPTEGFALGVPMVLLDVYGGHERDNAEFFEQRDLALINRGYKDVGKQIINLMTDDVAKLKMMSAQTNFRASMNIKSIVDFALNPAKKNFVESNLGMRGGTTIKMAKETLSKLDEASPADIELLLSYPTSRIDKFKGFADNNPFGHIAIRVKTKDSDRVYTANHLAKRGVEPVVLYNPTMEEYFYGTTPKFENQDFGSSYGAAYVRHTIGLRISGVSEERREAIVKAVEDINKGFNDGTYSWHIRNNNCADMTEQLLRAGGFDIPTEHATVPYAMPVEVFEKYMKAMEADPKMQVELVSYTRIPTPKQKYKFTRFPLSLFQVLRSLKHMQGQATDKLEALVTKRIAGYYNDSDLHFENVDGTSDVDTQAEIKKVEDVKTIKVPELTAKESQITEQRQELKTKGFAPDDMYQAMTTTYGSLSADDQKLVEAGQIDKLSPQGTETMAQLKTYLGDANDSTKDFQKNLDEYIQDELDMLIDQGFSMAKISMAGLRMHTSKSEQKTLNDMYASLQKDYDSYQANKSLYGGPKDNDRIITYRNFFFKLKAFVTKVNTVTKTGSDARKNIGQVIVYKFKLYFDAVRRWMQFGPRYLRLLTTLYFNPKGMNDDKSHDLIKSLKHGTDALEKSLNIKTEVTGLENVPTLADDKTINIYVASHRNPIWDLVVMGKIMPEDSLVAVAPDLSMPKFIGNQFEKTNSMIVIGRGSDKPITKIVEQLKNSGSRNIYIYPEGSTPALDETRPLREKFAWGLLARLNKENYKVNLVPVTYQNLERFLEDADNVLATKLRPENNTLKVTVEKPITNAMLQMMMNTDTQLVNRYIREVWHDDLKTDDTRLLGKTRATETQKKFEENIFGKTFNKSFCNGMMAGFQ